MLLSWLDNSAHGGLYPGRVWLDADTAAPLADGRSPDMLTAFSALLAAKTPPGRKGRRIVLTVSDQLAAIAALPWQAALTRPAEVDAYAQVCFERQGQRMDGDWVMVGAFRDHQRMGLAYALPTAWLAQLREIALAHGMVLDTVMPISAAAYFHQRRPRGGARKLVVLRETGRTSALMFDHAGLIAYDLETVAGSAEQSSARLLRRLQVLYGEIGQVDDWSPEALEARASDGLIAGCLPLATARHIDDRAWR